MVKQSFEELHEFMKNLPEHKFDNDDVMEQLDLMLQDLGKQKLAGFSRAVSLTFLPERPPPQYPIPPEPFRSLTLRREHRRTVQSLPPGVGLPQSYNSGSSISEEATSPGGDSTVSAPTMLPMQKETPALTVGGGNLGSPDSAVSEAVGNGGRTLELPVEYAQENDDEEQAGSAATPQAEQQEDSVAVPQLGDHVEQQTVAENSQAIEAAVEPAAEDLTPVTQLPNGGVASQEKDPLRASGSDSSLRIRVSTI